MEIEALHVKAKALNRRDTSTTLKFQEQPQLATKVYRTQRDNSARHDWQKCSQEREGGKAMMQLCVESGMAPSAAPNESLLDAASLAHLHKQL